MQLENLKRAREQSAQIALPISDQELIECQKLVFTAAGERCVAGNGLSVSDVAQRPLPLVTPGAEAAAGVGSARGLFAH